MSGFDNGAVDAAFFADTPHVKSNFISTLGYGDPASIFERSPRPDFARFHRIDCRRPRVVRILVIDSSSEARSVALFYGGAPDDQRPQVLGRGPAGRAGPEWRGGGDKGRG